MGNVFENSPPLMAIEQELKSWDLSPTKGGGLYFKTEKYAHIELQLSGSATGNDVIDWSPVDGLMPQGCTDHIPGVENLLQQFADHFRQIRGENLFLNFTITDTSYHPTDYRRVAYEWVTMHALINCFKPNSIPFDTKRIWRKK